ncbi:MAG: hypothetical protein ACTSYD_01585 [Candidatus Heimdallarchaeaceae archaeon]
MVKIPRIFGLLFMLTLLITLSPSFNVIGQSEDEERTWDYQGLIPTQSERGITKAVTDPYQYEYHIFMFDNDKNLVGPETIVTFYGLAKLINAPLFTQFFWDPDVTTGSIYRFALNKTVGLEWINITSDKVDPASPTYDPILAQHYEEIKLRLSAHKEIFENNDPYFGKLFYPIHFVDLTKRTGIVGYWEQQLKDGTLIGGRFYTYGADNPLFTDPKTNETWPTFNITIVQDNYRSALPQEHSIKVPFPFLTVAISVLAISTLVVKHPKTMRRVR